MEGYDREDLLQSIRQPNKDEDENENANKEKQKVERIAIVIWQAIGEVAAISQETDGNVLKPVPAVTAILGSQFH